MRCRCAAFLFGTALWTSVWGCSSDEENLFTPPVGVSEAGADAVADGSSTPDGLSSTDATSEGGCNSESCDDDVECTVDRCVNELCTHSPDHSTCAEGHICDLIEGCVAGVDCTSNQVCQQHWASEPCKTNIRCDPQTKKCLSEIKDDDGDKAYAEQCGGQDCNDSDPLVGPSAQETCDGKDNDCDGQTDEQVTCSGLLQCIDGACQCDEANTCGAVCVDTQTDLEHCGECFHPCPSAATCQGGECGCSGGKKVCGNACVDTSSDPSHCGNCTSECAVGYSCEDSHCVCLETSCNGVCIDTTSDMNNCGACGRSCPAGATCQGSACKCPGTQELCGQACVDTTSSEVHCGECDNPCPEQATCEAGECECPSGGTICDGVCKNTETDPTNCGECGRICSSCMNGECACLPPDLMILLDQSGSMSDPLTTSSASTRWWAATSAIEAFASDPGATGVGVGLQYMPIMIEVPTECVNEEDCLGYGPCFLNVCLGSTGGGASCNVEDYQQPAVAIGEVPDIATSISSSLGEHQPEGNTPTAPSLQGVLEHAKQQATERGRAIAVVFISDGEPTVCEPMTFEGAAAIAGQYASASPPIRTFMIGLGSEVAASNWHLIAASGGTSEAFLPATGADIKDALMQVRAVLAECEE